MLVLIRGITNIKTSELLLLPYSDTAADVNNNNVGTGVDDVMT